MMGDDGRWWQDQHGDWHHPTRGSWRLANDGRWYPLRPPGAGLGRPIAIVLVLGLLVGGCSFIVSEPVIALAIVFVGIPFAMLMLWLLSVVAAPRR